MLLEPEITDSNEKSPSDLDVLHMKKYLNGISSSLDIFWLEDQSLKDSETFPHQK